MMTALILDNQERLENWRQMVFGEMIRSSWFPDKPWYEEDCAELDEVERRINRVSNNRMFDIV